MCTPDAGATYKVAPQTPVKVKVAGVPGHHLAFVPGTTSFDKTMADLLKARPITELESDPLIGDLRSFTRSLAKKRPFPVGQIFIASHANPEGLLRIKLDIVSGDSIEYEDLEAAVASKSLEIDVSKLQPRPVDAAKATIPLQINIRGCRIGKAKKFLLKLKEAFGGQIPITAPKHFHDGAKHGTPVTKGKKTTMQIDGYIEYMSYSFGITNPVAFKKRDQLIAAFKAAGFTSVDGGSIPDSTWKAVPQNIGKPVSMKKKVTSPVTNATEDSLQQFRVKQRSYGPGGSFNMASDPGTDAQRKAALQSAFDAAFPRFTKSSFPEYERFGHKSVDEFMDSWDWKFKYNAKSKLMNYSGSRWEYTLVDPIVDSSNVLYMNYYPVVAGASVIENLQTSDARFFETV